MRISSTKRTESLRTVEHQEEKKREKAPFSLFSFFVCLPLSFTVFVVFNGDHQESYDSHIHTKPPLFFAFLPIRLFSHFFFYFLSFLSRVHTPERRLC